MLRGARRGDRYAHEPRRSSISSFTPISRKGDPLKICVYGAGAIGGHVAARLTAARHHDISVIARGETLAAIREGGLTLHSAGEVLKAEPAVVTDDPSRLPPQDLVIVTVKAPGLPPIAEAIARLLGPAGCALFLVNGIPWWWHYGREREPRPLPALDPDALLWKHVRPERALGSAVYSSNELVAPALIHHTANNRWVIGEPDGSMSPRLNAVVQALGEAGLAAEAAPDIHRVIWQKNVTTASGNAVSALTRLDFYELGVDPQTRALLQGLMREIIAVGVAVGIDLRAEIDVEKLSQRGKAHSRQRPHSMLWDVLTNRRLEVDAQLGQVQTFAREHGVLTPTLDVIATLLRALDRADRHPGVLEQAMPSGMPV
jgi:2-dehydropantoate 2-reductase